MGIHRQYIPTRLNEVERETVTRVAAMLGNNSAALRFIVACFGNIAAHIDWNWAVLQKVRCGDCTQSVSLGEVPSLIEQPGDAGRLPAHSQGIKRPPQSIRPKVNRRRMARLGLRDYEATATYGITPFPFSSPMRTLA